MSQEEFTVNEDESRELLKKLKDEVFNGYNEELAFALGRPQDEVEDWLGGGAIDDDGQIKIHGVAKERLS